MPSRFPWPDHRAPRCSSKTHHSSSRHQHLAGGQQRRRVIGACGAEAAGAAPGSSGRIIQLRAAQALPPLCSSCHQHLARAAASPCDRSVRCRGCRLPSRSRRRIIQLRAAQVRPSVYPPATSTLPWAATSPCEGACGAEAAGRRPRASRRIIELRAAQGETIIVSSRHQHLA